MGATSSRALDTEAARPAQAEVIAAPEIIAAPISNASAPMASRAPLGAGLGGITAHRNNEAAKARTAAAGGEGLEDLEAEFEGPALPTGPAKAAPDQMRGRLKAKYPFWKKISRSKLVLSWILAGFLISEGKCSLEPEQRKEYLSTLVDTVAGSLFVPQAKRDNARALLQATVALFKTGARVRDLTVIGGTIQSMGYSFGKLAVLMTRGAWIADQQFVRTLPPPYDRGGG
ncbi:hypothetical protein TSOC_010493 [Tetrabaena socialis]|uniref:Uncharacterized protein n=1 Tax=Tetrabaena socialis TaxID=47790 RepID=A0A2J7ZT50_9CHLO|nr:hypothetical protein TSOC_010493 [Tetrabaena socialis]|eukprot:PNH03451.1 hypothetical protein TSOC_010493 [Tetrabaena socialis]